MAALCKRDLTIKGLLACGYYEEIDRSSKYRCFRGCPGRLYLVGKSGAFRKSKDYRLTPSASLTGGHTHKSFIYIGRICDSCELSADQFEQIRNEHFQAKGVGFEN